MMLYGSGLTKTIGKGKECRLWKNEKGEIANCGRWRRDRMQIVEDGEGRDCRLWKMEKG